MKVAPLRHKPFMKLLFVCSGNTCRSPLALACWEAHVRAQDNGKLNSIRAASAGLHAQTGAPASAHAVAIAREWGSPLDSHRARQLQASQVEEADWICVMTPEHAAALWHQFPAAASRILLLGDFAAPTAADAQLARLLEEPTDSTATMPPGAHKSSGENTEDRSILDPYGGSREAYNACAGQIERAIQGLAKALSSAEMENAG